MSQSIPQIKMNTLTHTETETENCEHCGGFHPDTTKKDDDDACVCEGCEKKVEEVGEVGECDGRNLCEKCVDEYNANFSYEGREWCDACDETHGEGEQCYPKKRYVIVQ